MISEQKGSKGYTSQLEIFQEGYYRGPRLVAK